MNFNNSKLFETNILNDMAETSQEKRVQQSQAMFSGLSTNQYQKCEEDFFKNQHIMRHYYDQQNDFSKSNVTGDDNLNVSLVFSPAEGGFEFPPSPDGNGSTQEEIFVLSVHNIAKIAQVFNVDYVKLKELFIKIINDEEVNENFFVNRLNSKQSTGENVNNSPNITNKTTISNQSTQTNDGYIQVRPLSNNEMFKIIESELHDQDKTFVSIFNVEKLQRAQTNNSSINLSQNPSDISSQLLSLVDDVLGKKSSTETLLVRNSSCSSPDLFSDASDDDCIPQST